LLTRAGSTLLPWLCSMAACVMAVSTLWLDCITRSAPAASADSGAAPLLLLLLKVAGWSAVQGTAGHSAQGCIAATAGIIAKTFTCITVNSIQGACCHLC
jgi:hypothetical protein